MDSQPSLSGRFRNHSNTSNSHKDLLGRSSSSLLKSISDGSSQSLSSILNNPHDAASSSSWVGWWSSSTAVTAPEFAPLAAAAASKSELSRSDFQHYLDSISEPHGRFEHIRNHSNKESTSFDDLEGAEEESIIGGGQGDALVACLRQVPALFFKEDFALEDGATFRTACPFSTMSENLVLQEKLSQYLDVVELHLVKEISLRSNSFFDAQGQLQDLNVKIVEGCSRIRELKETIRLLDADLVDSARRIHDLNATRSNLLALQQKLRLILYVNQALSALSLLVASADCAGALDVTDDLQHLLDGDDLTGLHCFRHLQDHVAASIDTINSILSADFMRTSIHDAGNRDAVILSRARARANLPTNEDEDEVNLDEEETSSFRDRLLPLIIGLLRTAKLPSVLRIYRDTLTADMKNAIKTAVADLLPVLLAQPLESDFTQGERTVDADGGSSSLARKLRSMSTESFVQLLAAIFSIVRAHLVRSAEVKKAIEWIMCNIDGHYAADSVAAAIAIGAVAAEAQETDGQGGSFMTYSPHRNAARMPSLQANTNDAPSPSNVSKNFRADVLRENTEAVFAACDAAHGRWAKLLGVRALLHPRLRLPDFLDIYNISQKFMTATVKIGGRLGYSIRGTLQSQAKAFVDFQHESRMAKIKAVLDQETWIEVDVPDEYQAIFTSLFCSEPLTTGNVNDGQDNTGEMISLPEVLRNYNDNSDVVTTAAQSSTTNNEEHGRASLQALSFRGVDYRMVNCGLMLLKLLSEYIDMNRKLPMLSSEVVHRVVEILKFFNTRTCQLVLGAGAMQVSGLRSITSKHLALASQVVSFIHAIIPEIRSILFIEVPETRKALLLSEIDRVAQDYKVHRDEIHTKLVQIMRERLLVHLRGLPQIVESWNRLEDSDSQPSQFARSLTKEVGFLQRVLSRTLHEVDVQSIFRQVVIIFHSQISEALSNLDISTEQAKIRLCRDVQHILGCIRSLPSDNPSGADIPNWGQLDEFLAQRFGPDGGE
ncbi:vacuolar protein sorting-associated protein 54, chloroplastic isoform X2 [Actinidia eriantha]|uniref:vacuolar protein sorting-associated protein 54, chloroplastic isoform X2 n=1 Tax=Actinidia eriantha TaxID=165200 RepID=UPI00258D5F77|nr:vacuolar protein sorting-associated protein 54, chloroplastic isoform X2 [Actinidia eriantha]